MIRIYTNYNKHSRLLEAVLSPTQFEGYFSKLQKQLNEINGKYVNIIAQLEDSNKYQEIIKAYTDAFNKFEKAAQDPKKVYTAELWTLFAEDIRTEKAVLELAETISAGKVLNLNFPNIAGMIKKDEQILLVWKQKLLPALTKYSQQFQEFKNNVRTAQNTQVQNKRRAIVLPPELVKLRDFITNEIMNLQNLHAPVEKYMQDNEDKFVFLENGLTQTDIKSWTDLANDWAEYATWLKDLLKNFKGGISAFSDKISDEFLDSTWWNQTFSLLTVIQTQLYSKSIPDVQILTGAAKQLKSQLQALFKAIAATQTELAKDNWEDAFRQATRDEMQGQKGQVQKTWTEYYKKEWPNISRRALAEIGPAFTEEVNHYGFPAFKNPFVSYLKHQFQTVSDFESLLTQNPSAYLQIHNAVSKNNLTENELWGLGLTGFDSIIFAKDFYTQPTDEILKYLSDWSKINKLLRGASNSSELFAHNFLKKIYNSETNGDWKKQFLIDLFYNGGKLFEGPQDKRQAGNPQDGLQPVEQIRNAINVCFKPEKLGDTESEQDADTAKMIKPENVITIAKEFRRGKLSATTADKLASIIKKIVTTYSKYVLDPFKGNEKVNFNSNINLASIFNELGIKLPEVGQVSAKEGTILNNLARELYKVYEYKVKE